MVGEELKKSHPSRARVSETIGCIIFIIFIIHFLSCFFPVVYGFCIIWYYCYCFRRRRRARF